MSNNHLSLVEIYTFLAMAMQYPLPGTYSPQFVEMYILLAKEIEKGDEIEHLEKFMHTPQGGIKQNENGWVRQLQAEHTRLFINAYPHVIAPPFGSYHIPNQALSHGSYISEVMDFYSIKGLEINNAAQRADHLSVQLEFLGHLEAIKDNDGVEEFLENFFRPWFVPFRNKVIEGSSLPFYPSLARVIDFFTR